MEKEPKFKIEETEQIVEGTVDDADNWWEGLPAGVKKEDVIVRRVNGGRLEWHLREGAIKNPTEEQIRRARVFEKEIWE